MGSVISPLALEDVNGVNTIVHLNDGNTVTLLGVSKASLLNVQTGLKPGVFTFAPLTGGNHDDILIAVPGNNTIIGNGGNDTIHISAGGNDTVIGGEGDDIIYAGAALTSSDKIDGGSGGGAPVDEWNSLVLTGAYGTQNTPFNMNSAYLTNLSSFVLKGAYDYNLTFTGSGIWANSQKCMNTINASDVSAANLVKIDASQTFVPAFAGYPQPGLLLIGHAGNDVITGTSGNDIVSVSYTHLTLPTILRV